MSISAYRRQKEAAETPRELECRAFSTVIGKLIEGQKTGGKALIEACYLNNQLWTALTVDLSLAIWVQRYTPQAMGGTAPVDPLIAVNRNILDGLSTKPSGAGTQQPAVSIGQLGAV